MERRSFNIWFYLLSCSDLIGDKLIFPKETSFTHGGDSWVISPCTYLNPGVFICVCSVPIQLRRDGAIGWQGSKFSQEAIAKPLSGQIWILTAGVTTEDMDSPLKTQGVKSRKHDGELFLLLLSVKSSDSKEGVWNASDCVPKVVYFFLSFLSFFLWPVSSG